MQKIDQFKEFLKGKDTIASEFPNPKLIFDRIQKLAKKQPKP